MHKLALVGALNIPMLEQLIMLRHANASSQTYRENQQPMRAHIFIAKAFNTALILLAILIIGCQTLHDRFKTTTEDDARQEAYRNAYDPLMGMTEEDIIMQKGPPTRVYENGAVRILIYHKTHEVRSSSSVFANSYGAAGSGSAWESFDEARIFIKDGKAIKWDASWQ